MGDQTVQVGVGGVLDVEGVAADVIGNPVIKEDGDISVLKESVGGQDAVVRLNDGSGHLRGRVHE